MSNIIESNNIELNRLKVFVFLSPFLFGGFHIWTSAVFSLVLSAFLIISNYDKKVKNKANISVTVLSLILIPLSYLVMSLWAVDSGTAVYGFIKFLPVALFALNILPLSKDDKTELLDTVPYSAVAMGIISYGLSFIPALSEYFLVASRLGGFFQYPNSFACYCLVGIPVLLLKEKVTYKNWILAALLVGIIFLTGSRTVFLLLAAVSIILLVKIKSKNKIRFLALIVGAVCLSVVIALLTDSLQTVGRYLTISLESSTLLGRLLYYKDALPVILKHPFGLGYYGYYFSQGSFQTGVYSVAYAHNDLLQLFLDIGWVPTLLFAFVTVKSFFSPNKGTAEKIILMIISVHSLFDFDQQFISVFLLLVLALDFETANVVTVKFKGKALIAAFVPVMVLSVYFGAVNGLFLLQKYETVEKIYGKDTQSQIFLMYNEKDYEKINSYAESILSRNSYVSIAYSAKANYAYKNGDIESVIVNKEKAIECAAYSIEEYNDYCQKLLTAIDLYARSGDMESAQYCVDRLIAVEDKLDEVKDKTDPLAWKIKDKPELELSEEYSEYINEFK